MDFNADAVVWNLDRYFKNDSLQFEPAGAGMTRARVPVMGSYRKIDEFTVAITTKEPASYIWQCISCSPHRPPSRRQAVTGDASRRSRLPAPGHFV